MALFNDPLRRGANNKLVLCEPITHDGEPCVGNRRARAAETMRAAADCEPWFGIEQEWLLLDADGWPYGWLVARAASYNSNSNLKFVGQKAAIRRHSIIRFIIIAVLKREFACATVVDCVF